ncbi:MAG: dynamin family protein [Anaerolineae bacterium]|nr:dynamin family protein [Anaerolineae bacterium]
MISPFLANQERFLKVKMRCVEIIQKMISFAHQATEFTSNDNFENDIERLKTLIDRTESDLLTLAFFGSFSSGKSFLISGLIGKLEWYSEEDDGELLDEYVSLIPSSPRQTSNCPLSVEPANSEVSQVMSQEMSEAEFWVKFNDHSEWEKKPINPASIQAYITDLDDIPINRLSRDRSREVSQAKLLVRDSEMQARLYDLPGIGSIGEKYTRVVHSAVQKADCIIFVASANKPIGEEQLELLQYIYEHHQATSKTVFFVLTQIDKERDRSRNKPNWQIVKEANNKFLRKYFCLDGKPDSGFIGKEFFAISPAWEVKGKKLIEEGNRQQGERLLLKSNMQSLREELRDYLNTTSGPLHLIEILWEAKRILIQLVQDLIEIEKVEGIPYQELQQELESKKDYLNKLIDGQQLLARELPVMINNAIDQAFLYSQPNDLAEQLKQKLSGIINKQDVLHVQTIHQIQLQGKQAIREWFNRPRFGVRALWSEAWGDLNDKLEHKIEEITQNAQLNNVGIKANEKNVDPEFWEEKYATSPDTIGETVKMARDIWPTVTALGISSVLPGIVVGAATLMTPVGWAAIIAGVTATVIVGRKKGQLREERRREMLRDLEKLPQSIISSYKDQLRGDASTLATSYNSIIDGQVRTTRQAIETLEDRLVTPGNQALESRLQQIRSILDNWNDISSATEKLKRKIEQLRTINDNMNEKG